MIFDLIYDYLNYEDRLVLRSTCKALREFVDSKKNTKLNLFVRKFPYYHQLFYTNEPISYSHSYHTDHLSILASPRFRKQFTDLQRLTICCKGWGDFRDKAGVELDLHRLNIFRSLNQLDIDEFPRIKGKLALPELEIAAFRVQIKVGKKKLDTAFELECPRLTALKINFCRPTLSGHTDQLDYLHYGDHEDRNDYLASISPNLRRLSTICFETIRYTLEFLDDLKKNRLTFPALNKIKLVKCNKLELDALASALEDLYRDRHTRHIQFIAIDKPIGSPDELRHIASMFKDNNDARLDLRFLKMRSLLFLNVNPVLNFLLSEARYVELHENFELNEKTIKKLKNIEFLEFKEPYKPNELTFELFAKNCKFLRLWTIYNQKIQRRTLERISGYLLNLEAMRIFECQYETLEPLADFQNLERLDLDFNPEPDELAYIYLHSRSLETVNMVGKREVRLLRTTAAPWLHRIMILKDSMAYEFSSLQAMIKYYYEKRMFEKRDDHAGSTQRPPAT